MQSVDVANYYHNKDEKKKDKEDELQNLIKSYEISQGVIFRPFVANTNLNV